MKIVRKEFLDLLTTVLPGTSKTETFCQSDCFVFKDGKIHAFNGDIAVVADFAAEWEAAIPAPALIDVLGRLTETDLDFVFADGELRIKGERKTAGIKAHADIEFPLGEIPEPAGFKKAPAELFARLKQAGRVCASDESSPRTTHIHLTRACIEATDGFRLYRTPIDLPIKREILIPAAAIAACKIIQASSVSAVDGWFHAKLSADVICSIRCAEMDYFAKDDLDKLLAVKGSKLQLPQNLPDILKRAAAMESPGEMHVTLKDDLISLRTENDNGWYCEKKKVKYAGNPLRFTVNPKFLLDILQHSHEVTLGTGKMKIREEDGTQFVVALEIGE